MLNDITTKVKETTAVILSKAEANNNSQSYSIDSLTSQNQLCRNDSIFSIDDNHIKTLLNENTSNLHIQEITNEKSIFF
jgi:hypothetical protein